MPLNSSFRGNAAAQRPRCRRQKRKLPGALRLPRSSAAGCLWGRDLWRQQERRAHLRRIRADGRTRSLDYPGVAGCDGTSVVPGSGRGALPVCLCPKVPLITARRPAVMAPGPGGGDGCASRTRTDILSHPRTGGRARDAGLVPAVQKAAGLLSRSCRNRREQDPDVVGKLQLATLESREYFLEIYC
jgi:hypothetical protein